MPTLSIQLDFYLYLTTSGAASEALTEVIDSHLENASKVLEAIRYCCILWRCGALRQVTYTLKSSSATLGATHLSQLCTPLEEIEQAGTVESGVERISQLKADYKAAKTALQQNASDRPILNRNFLTVPTIEQNLTLYRRINIGTFIKSYKSSLLQFHKLYEFDFCMQ